MPPEDLGACYLPLDRETRLRLMDRARVEQRNPLELGAELLAAKLQSDEQATRPAHLN